MSPPPPAPTNVSNPLHGLSALRMSEDVTSLPISTLTIDERLKHLGAITGNELHPQVGQQLRDLLSNKSHPIAFDGIEPSGRITLASGLLRVLNVRRLVAAGCRVRLWIADVHALLNNKLGGDLKKIQNLVTYLLEVWKALGLDPSTNPNVEILLASAEIASYSDEYWSKVLDIAGRFTVERVQQCTPIMGRSVDDVSGNTNRVLYPIMQVADGLLLQADIYQMGTDQETALALLEEYAALKPEGVPQTRVVLSHELLFGLKQEQVKMSTSDPESAIYVDDTSVELASKIKKAYCPPGIVEHNPILQYMKQIVFPCVQEDSICLERSEKNGGDLVFSTYSELEQAYVSGLVHPADLKPCVTKYLNLLLEPVRQHFASGELKKLWTNIKKMKISSVLDGDKLVTLPISGYPETEQREWKTSTKTLDERYACSRSVGEECIQDNELKALLEKKENFICYDGFEPSGRMHIAQGVLRTVNVNRLTSSGAIFRFWVADWFAMLNNKMGGDLNKIRTVGRYMVEIWKSAGMDMSNVQFLWASNEIIANGATYWLRVMDIARRTTIARTVKCCTIMGRKEKEGMFAAQILYPLMQCADIFFLKADICQLGMDQRKINMLARDYCDLIKNKFKPIILSHHMLMGLKQGQEKMSKSDPESAIYMEDAREDVIRKIEHAYCPERIVEANPILDYMKHIIFPRFTSEEKDVVITKDIVLTNYETLEQMYVSGEISPQVLKEALATHLNEILEPVRVHFSNGEAKELLAKVRSYRITR